MQNLTKQQKNIIEKSKILNNSFSCSYSLYLCSF